MSLKSAEKTGTNEYTLELSVDAESFEAAVNKAYHKNKGKIDVPGFRKGKAPRAFIEKIYGENVFYDDALEIVFPDEYEAAVSEAAIDAVGSPFDFEIKSMGKDGADIVCKVTVKPVIELEGYKGLSAVKEKTEVTAEEVEADLKRKLESNAREITVEGRPVQNGDIAVIDFDGSVDGVHFDGGKSENYDLEIGSGSFIPGFEEQIIGHNAGDEFDVNVKFPEEYAAELAGKDAVFAIKLHSIKTKQLPEADDEFAKDVSEFDTLAELKADIEKALKERKEQSASRNFESTVLDNLAGLVNAEIPEVMVEKETENMISEFEYRISSQGINIKTYLSYLGMDMDSFKASYKERAEKEVKITLALEKIAELENIEVAAEDVDAEYAKLAETYNVDAETVKKAVLPENIIKSLKAQKATAVVIDNAVALDKAPEEKPKKKATPKKAKKAENKEEAPAEESAE